MLKIDQLLEQLQKKSIPSKKEWWENYLRHEIDFLGVPMAIIRDTVVNQFYHEKNVIEVSEELFKVPVAEAKLAAILLLENEVHNLQGSDVVKSLTRVFEREYIYDWNTCDWLCIKVLSKLIQRDQEYVINGLLQWINEPNLWQRRASLVAFVSLPHLEDYDEYTFDLAGILIKSPERFSKTAVGWFLRERSKTNTDIVKAFLHKNADYLTTEVINNSMKYLDSEEKTAFKRVWKEKTS